MVVLVVILLSLVLLSLLATLAYPHFKSTLPLYLSQTLTTYQPSPSRRSSNEKWLKVPKTNLKTFGPRYFGFLAPTIWNSLPIDFRMFHLFLAYLCSASCTHRKQPTAT